MARDAVRYRWEKDSWSPAGQSEDHSSREKILVQAHCQLSGAAGYPPSGECAAKKILFLHVQHGNVYENKGPLWKSGAEPGMFMKIKVVIR